MRTTHLIFSAFSVLAFVNWNHTVTKFGSLFKTAEHYLFKAQDIKTKIGIKLILAPLPVIRARKWILMARILFT